VDRAVFDRRKVLSFQAASTSADGDDEIVDADTLRFAGKYVTIDSTTDGVHHLVTVLAKRVAKIVTRN
jgi:hypothetical protein